MVCIVGKMVRSMLGIEGIIGCMGRVFWNGRMEGSMMEIMLMIKNMGLVSFNGMMEEVIKGNG